MSKKKLVASERQITAAVEQHGISETAVTAWRLMDQEEQEARYRIALTAVYKKTTDYHGKGAQLAEALSNAEIALAVLNGTAIENGTAPAPEPETATETAPAPKPTRLVFPAMFSEPLPEDADQDLKDQAAAGGKLWYAEVLHNGIVSGRWSFNKKAGKWLPDEALLKLIGCDAIAITYVNVKDARAAARELWSAKEARRLAAEAANGTTPTPAPAAPETETAAEPVAAAAKEGC